MSKPTFLLTNDDGIRVYFFRALVEALKELGTVYAAAPKQEQSWIGKAVSRHRDVKATPYNDYEGVKAWEIDGTPSDAINIALGHLLPEKPDVVVSGINIGYNAFVPVIYSSGTVAGALEGAAWGYPAVALSSHLKNSDFEAIKENPENPPEDVKARIEIAARLGAHYAAKLVGSKNTKGTVHNINFPTELVADTPWVTTSPTPIKSGSLFSKVNNDTYQFTYFEKSHLEHKSNTPLDYETFSNGNISLSILDFNTLGQS